MSEMSEHLTLERISSLLDEPEEGPAALDHLEECERCRREYERMSRMRMALSAVGDLEPPEGEWARILARMAGGESGPLAAEPPTGGGRPPGVVGRAAEGGGAAEEDAAGAFARRRWLAARWPLQAAAVLAMFAGGILVGRAVREPAAEATLRLADEEGGRVGTPAGGPGAEPDAPGGARLGARASEEAYLKAVADLASLRAPLAGGADPGSDPAAATEQLARLDAVRDALSEALEASPADPVLNNLLFEVADERETLSRQLSETLRLADLEYR